VIKEFFVIFNFFVNKISFREIVRFVRILVTHPVVPFFIVIIWIPDMIKTAFGEIISAI